MVDATIADDVMAKAYRVNPNTQFKWLTEQLRQI